MNKPSDGYYPLDTPLDVVVRDMVHRIIMLENAPKNPSEANNRLMETNAKLQAKLVEKSAECKKVEHELARSIAINTDLRGTLQRYLKITVDLESKTQQVTDTDSKIYSAIAENTRLHDKIKAMQHTIDDLRKANENQMHQLSTQVVSKQELRWKIDYLEAHFMFGATTYSFAQALKNWLATK